MAKKKTEKPQREVTKRQLSRWQKQKRRQRIAFGLGVFIIAAVICFVGVGWYINQYRPLHQTVIKVNGVKFDMDYYIRALTYYGKSLPGEFMQPLAEQVVEIIERNELVRQEATKLGISVSDDEVEEKLNSFDPPLSKDLKDVMATQMMLDKLRDEYFDKQVPVFAEQRYVMGMLLESESQAAELRARLEDGEDFTELAGEFSLENFSKTEGGDLGWQPEGFLTRRLGLSVPDEYAFSAEVGVLSQPVHDEEVNKQLGYWLIKVLKRDKETQQAYVQVVLLGSEEEARHVRARLETGEDFAALAEEFSQHDASKENEGYLDVTSPDMVSPAFDEFVFDSELEMLSQPIRDDTVMTRGGYWLLKVVDIEDNRRIEDEDRELLKTDVMNEWIEKLLDNPENKVESYLDEEKRTWAIERAVRSWN